VESDQDFDSSSFAETHDLIGAVDSYAGIDFHYDDEDGRSRKMLRSPISIKTKRSLVILRRKKK
jgi:hypothetical protein